MNYFDHAASTNIYPQVLDFLNSSFREDFSNPNSRHLAGASVFKKIEEARLFFLNSINADRNDFFIFTSSATESNNTIVKGLKFIEGDVILYSKADHPSMVAPIEEMAKIFKLKLINIELDQNGLIDSDKFKNQIVSNIKLVALTHVNNQSGVINDVVFLARLARKKSSAHIHVDASQSFSKINFKVCDAIDSVSITSHKVGGPKGIAGLFLKKSHQVSPLLLGGGQEEGLRSSTQAYPLIGAFALASKISLNKFEESFQKNEKIKKIIETALIKIMPNLRFPFKNTSPYILTFIIPGISADVILRHLEARGFFLSSTAACSSKQKGFNPVLAALNIAEIYHKNVIRLSLSHDTDMDQVRPLLEAFSEVWSDVKFLVK